MSEQQIELIKRFIERISGSVEIFIEGKDTEFQLETLSKLGCFFLVSYLSVANEDEDISKQRLNHVAQFVWQALTELKERINKEAVIE